MPSLALIFTQIFLRTCGVHVDRAWVYVVSSVPHLETDISQQMSIRSISGLVIRIWLFGYWL